MKARSALLTTSLLIAAGLLAGCSGSDTEAAADTATAGAPAKAPSPAVTAITDFEGTMQHLMISVDADTIGAIAGSKDLDAVLALPPERVIDAVIAGDAEATAFDRSTLEINGRMGRMQQKGQASYTILDGEQMAARVVDAENRMVVTMGSGGMAASAGGGNADPLDLGAEKVGRREIRGFDTTGYRFEFMDQVATAWLSEDLEAQTGPIFEVWSRVNPFGSMLEVGEGAPVLTVMVNPESLAGGSSFLPAYTVSEFHDLQAGDVPAERFELPDGYQQVDMADMANLGRGAQ